MKGYKIHYGEVGHDCCGARERCSWYDYDNKGNEIHRKDTDGDEFFLEYEFYSNGTLSKMVIYKRI